jgi:hypothetical protein
LETDALPIELLPSGALTGCSPVPACRYEGAQKQW